MYNDTKNKISIGATQEDEKLIWNIETFPHMMVAGASGSGKTTLLHNILNQVVSSRDKAFVIDIKKIGFMDLDFNDASFTPQIATTVPEAHKVLEEIKAELDIRYADMQKAGVTNFKQLPNLKPAMFILIDELIALIRPLDASVEHGLDKEISESNAALSQIMSLISNIARLGRAAGVYLVVTTQQPASELIPSELKQNLDARVALGYMSEKDSNVTINSNEASKLIPLSGTGIYRAGLNLIHFNILGK